MSSPERLRRTQRRQGSENKQFSSVHAQTLSRKSSLHKVNRVSHGQKGGYFFDGIGKQHIRHGRARQKQHDKVEKITEQVCTLCVLSHGREQKPHGKHGRYGEQQTYADGGKGAFDLYVVEEFSCYYQNGYPDQRHGQVDAYLRQHHAFLSCRRSVKALIDLFFLISRHCQRQRHQSVYSDHHDAVGRHGNIHHADICSLVNRRVPKDAAH